MRLTDSDIRRAEATVTVHHDGVPLPGVDVVALFPNKTRSQATTDDAGKVAFDQGRQQPVHFRFGRPILLTDACGVEMSVTIVDSLGNTTLVEYWPFEVASEGRVATSESDTGPTHRAYAGTALSPAYLPDRDTSITTMPILRRMPGASCSSRRSFSLAGVVGRRPRGGTTVV